MSLLVLTASDVSTITSFIPPDELISLMALVFFRLYRRHNVATPNRTIIATSAYSALFMPAHLDGLGAAMKAVCVPSADQQQNGLPATILVLDETTGVARAVVNARVLTPLRNAAGSALATRLVGPSDPQVLVAFGAGLQIRAHINLFLRSFPSLKRCIVVNRSENARLDELMRALSHDFPRIQLSAECTAIIPGDNQSMTLGLQEIIQEADIICTATPSTKPLFRSGWVKPGTHINLIGSYKPYMMEVESDLIRRSGKILVDSREACQIEAGELIQANLPPEDMIELGQIIDSDMNGISRDIKDLKGAGDVTIFKSVGVGLQDVAIANFVADKAIAAGAGTRIEAYD